MLQFEGDTLRRFDGVLAVSDADRDTFARLYPDSAKTPTWVIRTGVDTEYFVPSDAPAPDPHLVFTGSMDWLPNEDAMRYFCHDVLPLIREQEPRVSLSIVGRAPTPAVRALADGAGIEVTGTVDDVRPHMQTAAVYIVPLRIGGGTRLKIFEAMSMGKAVVSTTVGAEGLPVRDGEHALIADDPRDRLPTASCGCFCCRDTQKRHALETAARSLVIEHYDWSAVAGELDDALRQCASRHGRRKGLNVTPKPLGAASVAKGRRRAS